MIMTTRWSISSELQTRWFVSISCENNAVVNLEYGLKLSWSPSFLLRMICTKCFHFCVSLFGGEKFSAWHYDLDISCCCPIQTAQGHYFSSKFLSLNQGKHGLLPTWQMGGRKRISPKSLIS